VQCETDENFAAAVSDSQARWQELDYGADLDIIFIADGKAKDFSKLQRIAAAVMDLLSRQPNWRGVQDRHPAAPRWRERAALEHARGARRIYRHRAQLWGEIQP